MTSIQALKCITTSLNQLSPTSNDLVYGSSSLFQVTKDPHFAIPNKKPSKTAKKIAGQKTSSSTILDPVLTE